MISFIIIGKNEGKTIKLSIESVLNVIENSLFIESEILYIDSKSSDQTLKIVKSYRQIKYFELTGKCNAAIARNVGARESKGEVLFFIDGDMEIEPSFLSNALNEKEELNHDYLTGHLNDVFYNMDGQFIEKAPRTYTKSIPEKPEELNHNGGLFLIKKHVWNRAKGMRNKYKRSQDLDLTIRLKRMGIKIIRIPFLACNHHTVDYQNEKRMWILLWSGFGLYPAMIFRDHLFNFDVLKRVIRSNYTSLLLLLLILTLFINSFSILVSAIFYNIVLIFRVFIHSKNSKSTKNKFLLFFQLYIYQILLDISFWLGFLFFYPKNEMPHYK